MRSQKSVFLFSVRKTIFSRTSSIIQPCVDHYFPGNVGWHHLERQWSAGICESPRGPPVGLTSSISHFGGITYQSIIWARTARIDMWDSAEIPGNAIQALQAHFLRGKQFVCWGPLYDFKFETRVPWVDIRSTLRWDSSARAISRQCPPCSGRGTKWLRFGGKPSYVIYI
jgi:hypothetical protein